MIAHLTAKARGLFGVTRNDIQGAVARAVRDVLDSRATDAIEVRAKSAEPQPKTPTRSGADWPVLSDAARHGIAGQVVACIEPHSEADPVAILVQYLASFGNVVGRGPYYLVEGDKHHTNIFVVLVGRSGKGRKGTSAGRILQVMRRADPEWEKLRLGGGISSGEGLISAVKDGDKRLMVFENEFSSALVAIKRDGNVASQIIRSAWDHGNLLMMTKEPQRADGAHISIIGHITEEELRRELDRVGMANGFANRFLYACVRRSKFLPHGGALDDEIIDELGRYTAEAIEFARTIERMRMTPDARRVWSAKYEELSEGSPGLLGAITGRGEAQTLRLALLYALLQRKAEIDVDHLNAGLAVWAYCEASARYVFGDMLGDPVADDILRALRRNGQRGMTRTEIRDLFGRNLGADKIGAALTMLQSQNKAFHQERLTLGRKAEIWFAR